MLGPKENSMKAAKPSTEPAAPAEDAAPRPAPVVTRDKAISPADFAAVLTELRNSGIKPNPADISRALRKKGFVTTDRPPDDKIVHLSDASVPEQEIFATRARQYETGLDESLQEVGTLQQELQQYRKALPDLLSREAALLHQLELATGKLLTLETENAATTDLGTQLQDALDREANLKVQLEEIAAGTALSESLSRDLAQQREFSAKARQREKELTALLEQATARAGLTESLEAELHELRAKLEAQEQEGRRQAEAFAHKAGESAAALKDSQRRQTHLKQELAELRYQFHEAAEVAPAALATQLAETEQALEAVRQEVRARDSQLEQSRAEFQQTESALTEATKREDELLARAESAALQASNAERQLAAHLRTIDTGGEQVAHLQDQLEQALDRIARLLPEDAAPRAVVAPSSAEPLAALEAVLASLHAEVARAEEYHEFLKSELAKARQAPLQPVKPPAAAEPTMSAAPSGDLQIHLESAAFGKYLAEVIESELHRQTTALAELTRRGTELREQLEKAKPRSNKAQTLEGELASQGLFREDMTRRKAALAKLLDETIASLRAQSAAQAPEVPPAE
jgi:chromosome segregation ATPase